MNENEINDIRKKSEFKGITFSKFKKSDAKKELLKSLFNDKIESACYWAAEFACAGHWIELWNIILLFMSNNIHLGNPKLPIYIGIRFDVFKELVSDGYIGQELRLRNSKKIRILFAEIISILALSRKNNSFDTIKVNKTDFNITQMSSRLEADSVLYVKYIFMKGDPQELFIALNELAYHLSKVSKNKMQCFYWIEWILEFERACISKNNKCLAERRGYIPVESKYQMDVIWIVWEIMLRHSEQKGTGVKKIIDALLKLFCIRFTPSIKRKRKYILYFAISLLTEYVDLSIPLYTNEKIIEKVKNKINIIYKQVKKNEIAPKTSYLFNNNSSFNSGNLEKTIERLETMKKITNMLYRK